MTDSAATILVVTGLAVSVGLIVFFVAKFQSALADKEIDEITLADKAIEQKVDNMSLSDLVKSNNDDSKGSK